MAAGYDRSFDELGEPGPADAVASATAGGDVAVRGRRIELGAGVRLDLGGIVKGFAADRCARRLARVGPCLVNAGGDLAVGGTRPAGPWPVAVRLPRGRLDARRRLGRPRHLRARPAPLGPRWARSATT